MGADIHMYIEYTYKSEITEYEKHLSEGIEPDKLRNPYWRDFGGRINPGRNYIMFGILSEGVRYNTPNTFPAKGLPDDLGWSSRDDAFLYITEKGGEENTCTMEQALRWTQSGHRKLINSIDGKPTWVEHPDWHSHSWLTTEEYEKALEYYKDDKDNWGNPLIEYEAILAVMKSIESNGGVCRLVFWFDN